MMKTVTAPIPFAGSELREGRHVCAYFNSVEEEYRVLLPPEQFLGELSERRASRATPR